MSRVTWRDFLNDVADVLSAEAMSPRAPAPYQDWTSYSTISLGYLYVRTFLSPDCRIELTIRENAHGGETMEFAVHGKPGKVYPSETEARASTRI